MAKVGEQDVTRYFERLLEDKDLAALPLVFRAAVLDRYREGGARFVRTDNAGRFQLSHGPRPISLDFGIVAGAQAIQVLAGDLLKFPKSELAHWASHLLLPPLNPHHLRLRSTGGCVDDGEVRIWDGRLG